jgi:predicted dehydrogenase
MRVAFVGCGYVFDIYMRTKWAYPEMEICGVYDLDIARANVVAKHYGIQVYSDYDALLSDQKVEIVINLTTIRSHYEVTKRAIQAGKHVYSEKPVTTDIEMARELFALAESHGCVLTSAPCNIYSDSVSTLWKAVLDGAVGKPVLVYADLDENPAHLTNLEKMESPTGAPFPFVEEFQEGCTAEHIGYHLVWICAMFGPAKSVTAFSKLLVEHKTDVPLYPSDTPDYSVACLNFENGVAARVTCSWIAPRDHTFRIIGEDGQISADNVFHDQTPVYLERFSRVSLAARKAYTVRTQPLVGRLFGVGGRKLPLVRRWKSFAVEAERGVGRSLKHKFVSWLRRREIYAQDKLLGVAEMARAINDNRPQPLPPDFLIHLNELTWLVQRAGANGISTVPTTTFKPFAPLPDVLTGQPDYRATYIPRFFEKKLSGLIDSLQKR